MYRTLIKAKASVKEERVIKLQLSDSYFHIFVFMGKKRDYIMTENFCSCKSFLFNKIFKGIKDFHCYHLIALNIALQEDKVKILTVDKNTLIDIIMEIYSMEKSYILRKLVFS